MHLTPTQVDGLLRNVVTTHLNKLERLSAAAKSFPEFDPAQAERDEPIRFRLATAGSRLKHHERWRPSSPALHAFGPSGTPSYPAAA
jgi:hypothetical protein